MRTVILISAWMIADSINVAGNGYLVVWASDNFLKFFAYVLLVCIIVDLMDFFRSKKNSQ